MALRTLILAGGNICGGLYSGRGAHEDAASQTIEIERMVCDVYFSLRDQFYAGSEGTEVDLPLRRDLDSDVDCD